MRIEKTEDTPRTGVLIWILLSLLVTLLILWAASRYFRGSAKPTSNAALMRGIVFHHSATGVKQGSQKVDVSVIDAMHAQRGFAIKADGKWYHVGYHYLVLPDGTVQPGRPENVPGAHAKGFNDRFLGICFIGNFESESNPLGSTGPVMPTDKQLNAGVELAAKLMRKYDIPLQNVLCHRDVGQTQCPGDRFPYYQVLAKVASKSWRPAKTMFAQP